MAMNILQPLIKILVTAKTKDKQIMVLSKLLNVIQTHEDI